MTDAESDRLMRSAPTCNADTPDDILEPTDPATLEQAANVLPADLLRDDEVVILMLKPSPWFILLGAANTLVLIAVICGGAILLNQQFSFGEFSTEGMTTLALTLGIIRVFWQAFEWFSRTYVLTDRRVIRIKGVLQVEIFQCPLNELERPVLLYSFRERLFGLGTISFTTDKSVYPSAYWLMIRRPINVHRTILETIQRYGR